jgi:hypothetical protein
MENIKGTVAEPFGNHTDVSLPRASGKAVWPLESCLTGETRHGFPSLSITRQRAIILMGFPGVGKSYFADGTYVLDLDSSCIPSSYPDRFERYTEGVATFLERDAILLLPTHEAVVRWVQSQQLQARLVYPARELKESWIARLRQREARGIHVGLSTLLEKHWDTFLDSMESVRDPSIRHHVLGKDEYLSDVFHRGILCKW